MLGWHDDSVVRRNQYVKTEYESQPRRANWRIAVTNYTSMAYPVTEEQRIVTRLIKQARAVDRGDRAHN